LHIGSALDIQGVMSDNKNILGKLKELYAEEQITFKDPQTLSSSKRSLLRLHGNDDDEVGLGGKRQSSS
jgi:hypothetical protein